jgi:hypothetical protein
LHFSLVSSSIPRTTCLTPTIMSSVPTPFYEIHLHDDHDQSIGASSNMVSGKPFYPTLFDGVPACSLPNPDNISATLSHEELPNFLMNGVTDDAGPGPVFPTCNAFPHFQTSSLFLSGLTTSPESTLAPSGGPLRRNVPNGKRSRKSAYFAKSKEAARTRCTRGPTQNTTKKSYGAGFVDMFVRSPHPILDNHKRLLTKRNITKKNSISSRPKSNVLSTRFIPDVASPRPVGTTLRGKSTCFRTNIASICPRSTWT